MLLTSYTAPSQQQGLVDVSLWQLAFGHTLSLTDALLQELRVHENLQRGRVAVEWKQGGQ